MGTIICGYVTPKLSPSLSGESLVSSPDPPHHVLSENWRGKNLQFSKGAWCGGSGDETRESLGTRLVKSFNWIWMVYVKTEEVGS